MGKNPEIKDMGLSSLQERKSYFQTLLNNTEDLVIQSLNWNQRQVNLIYLATLTDQDAILDKLIFPLKRIKEGEFLDVIPLGQLQITCLMAAVSSIVKVRPIFTSFIRPLRLDEASQSRSMRRCSEIRMKGLLKG